MFDTTRSILQKIELPLLNKHKVDLFIKRDDLIDPVVSGNKWRKLKYNLLQAKNQKKSGVLTFGGAYSNHLVATAAACKIAGLNAIGVVRGEELDENSNETLKQCTALGMALKFVSRKVYNLRSDRQYWEELMIEHPNHFVVPEGGANYYGMIGCQELMNETPNDFDQIFIAQGTTTTSLGVLLSLTPSSTLNVIPALKGFDAPKEMQDLMKYSGFEQEMADELMKRVVVYDTYHFGGYGKYTAELLGFMEEFYRATNVPLDPVYTGKAMFALMQHVGRGDFEGQKIVFIHTGGIQGGRGIAKKEGRTFFDPAF